MKSSRFWQFERLRTVITLLIVFMVLVFGVVFSVTIGPWEIPLPKIGQIALDMLFGSSATVSDSSTAIIWYGRFPRTITGALVGFSLGCAGAIMQGIFKNPMASPGIIGTSSGAALGAVLAIYLGLASGSLYVVPLFSVTMAFLSLLVVLAIATTGGLTSRYTLLLGGIA